MKKPDIERIYILLKYILAVAGQEDWESRELGPIHLIKYVYLADLAYAEHTNGETFTGLPWRFHHFGPWAVEPYLHIEPALLGIGAQKKTISHSKCEEDMVRWFVQDDRLCDELEKGLPFIITGAVQKYVHRFGSDTASLLDFVYKTWPMVHAGPEELLDFTLPEYMKRQVDLEIPAESLTPRQQKKRKAEIESAKKRLREKLDAQKIKRQKKLRPTPPRYDDIFYEGLATLDSLAGEPVEPMECTAVFSDTIWKSKARFDPDVS